MPYASRRQQRWAHATRQPFARRWDKETPSFAALPEKKDAGAEAGAPLHGPGGLLGFPGGRKWGKRKPSVTTKPMTRSEAARVAALARWGKYTPHPDAPVARGISFSKQPKPTRAAAPKPSRAARRAGGKKGRAAAKPKKTEQERAQEQQAKRDQKQREREQARETARQRVYEQLHIAPDGRAALEALRRGEQPDPAAIARGGFVDAGLVEQAADGSYRMTPAGRALTAAAESGDAGRAGDTVSGARDRLSARRARQAAQEARKREAEAKRTARSSRSGGGRRRGSSRRADERRQAAANRRMARIRKRLADAFAQARRRTTTKSFAVFKDAGGAYRWVARSTTAYRDRDREILPIAALDVDSQRMTASEQFGPLRWWHLGQPDPFDTQRPWGPGLDLGDCDFSMQIGTTRVESGTFRSPQIAQRIAESTDEYELSPGFFHAYGPNGPPDGVYEQVRTFERSLVPTRYGRASNLFTGLTVKEQRMDPTEMERRFKAAIAELRLSPEQAEQLAAGLVQTDKSAQAQGVAFKSDDAPLVFTAPDGTQGIIHEGRFVALKSVMPEALADEEKADVIDQEGAPVDEMAEMMDDQSFIAAIADAVVAKIAPMFGDMKMSEFKTLLGGMAQKEASTVARIAVLEAEIARLKGDQPAVTMSAEVAAALKSQGPQAPPDPNAPQIPNEPDRPWAALGALTNPQLYGVQGYNGAAGWQVAQQPPQNTGGN